MTIALFSDVHANLPALEAVLADIDKKKPDATFCLGDLVGYNVWPNEVTELVRQRQIPAIAGNYDFGIGQGSDDCGCAYKTEEEKEMGKISISYTNQIVNERTRAYLNGLPAHINLKFNFGLHQFNLLLVHGSPRKINEYLFEDREEKSLSRILEQANADILCFGHTHIPYHRILTTGSADNPQSRHAINTGSVGKPKDGNPLACYVILHIEKPSVSGGLPVVIADFVRVSYDVEKAARAIENSPLPNAYAQMLRNGC